MALIKNFPLRNELSDLFDDQWLKSRFIDEWTPAINIIDNEKDYLIELAAPGMKREDFHVSMDNGLLTIEGKTEHEEEEKKKNYTRKEFSSTSFSRTFSLPPDVKEEVDAIYKDGVLKLTLLKNEHKLPPKKEILIK